MISTRLLHPLHACHLVSRLLGRQIIPMKLRWFLVSCIIRSIRMDLPTVRRCLALLWLGNWIRSHGLSIYNRSWSKRKMRLSISFRMRDSFWKLSSRGSTKLILMSSWVTTSVEVSSRSCSQESISSMCLTGAELGDWRRKTSPAGRWTREDTPEVSGSPEWWLVEDSWLTLMWVPRSSSERPTMISEIWRKSSWKPRDKISMTTCCPIFIWLRTEF